MAVYESSEPDVVLRVAKLANKALDVEPYESEGCIIITTETAGRTVTLQPGWLEYGNDLFYGDPGYSARYTWHGWPQAVDGHLPATQVFKISTFGKYDNDNILKSTEAQEIFIACTRDQWYKYGLSLNALLSGSKEITHFETVGELEHKIRKALGYTEGDNK